MRTPYPNAFLGFCGRGYQDTFSAGVRPSRAVRIVVERRVFRRNHTAKGQEMVVEFERIRSVPFLIIARIGVCTRRRTIPKLDCKS